MLREKSTSSRSTHILISWRQKIKVQHINNRQASRTGKPNTDSAAGRQASKARLSKRPDSRRHSTARQRSERIARRHTRKVSLAVDAFRSVHHSRPSLEPTLSQLASESERCASTVFAAVHQMFVYVLLSLSALKNPSMSFSCQPKAIIR